ncbi:MAG: hypothetical protein ABIO71_07515 [Caldimonas sp.]
MTLEPWLIASWPIIDRPCSSDTELASGLLHLGTTVSGDRDDFGRLFGNTIWGTPEADIGIAWDWTEAHDGVFAVSDPMGIVSNVNFIDDSGEALCELKAAVSLNRIAHSLSWQGEVAEATRALRTSSPRIAHAKMGSKELARRPGETTWSPSLYGFISEDGLLQPLSEP